uniref:Uncharacterized protein n=1 Tax=Arundo donax TaxID=35708 RepID=A0A0A8XNY2_ARUDO
MIVRLMVYYLRCHPPIGTSFSCHLSLLSWVPRDTKICNFYNLIRTN